MFFSFLVLITAAKNNCQFKQPNVISEISGQLSTIFKGVGAIFGLDVRLDFPDLDEILEKGDYKPALPYLFGLAGYVIIVALLIVILLLYFFLGQLVACFPRFRPSVSLNPTCKSSCSHIFFAFLMYLAIGLFFFSATQISKGLNTIADIPTSLVNTVDKAADNVDKTVNNSITFLNKTLNNYIDTYGNSITYMDLNLNGLKQKSDSIINLVNTKIENYATNIKTEGDKFINRVTELNLSDNSVLQQVSKANDVTEKIKLIKKSFGVFSDHSPDLNDFNMKQKATKTLYTNNISKKINGFISYVLNDMEFIFDVKAKKLDKTFSKFNKVTDGIKKYMSIVVYFVISVFLIITTIYTVIYFFRNGCARCFAASFCSCGLLLTIVLGIPSIVFTLLFTLFYDECPFLETALNQVGTHFLSEGAEFDNLLLCPDTLNDNSFYALAGLSGSFDYIDYVLRFSVDLRDQKSQFVEFYTTGVLQTLAETEKFDMNQIANASYYSGFDMGNVKVTLAELVTNPDHEAELMEYLNTIEINVLNMKKDMTDSLAELQRIQNGAITSKSFIERIGDINANVDVNLSEGVYKTIRNTLSEFSCNDICPVYVPIKNSLCVNLVDGFSFWLFSAVFMLTGSFLMSMSICKRRRAMKAVAVESEFDLSSDYYDDDDDYDEDPFVVK